jgi:hypothetical protein
MQLIEIRTQDKVRVQTDDESYTFGGKELADVLDALSDVPDGSDLFAPTAEEIRELRHEARNSGLVDWPRE